MIKWQLKFLFGIALFCLSSNIIAQQSYWQQRAEYKIVVELDDRDHSIEGNETIVYTNNSPDTLNSLFFHLYFNAFQPGSLMDMKSLTIKDPDKRIGERISKLNKDEIGRQEISNLKCNGEKISFHVEGTVLEAKLGNAISPGETVTLTLDFKGQVPVQIRRSGRNNKEGIDYSMAQWYPKLAEYDEMGWHADPYVAREFYGVWGDFDVSITLDSKYVVGASGILTNAVDIGHGYSDQEPSQRKEKTTWIFKAENVHDFAWAADQDYVHIVKKAYNGTMLHFIYQPNEKTNETWPQLPMIMDEALRYMNETFGVYPYPTYSFIQAGDGGMEYAMATLILGEGVLPGLVGLATHEWIHSWYQHVLGTNESLYAWMDEGFTSYAETCTMEHLKSKKLIPGDVEEFPWKESIKGYTQFVLAGRSEALSTHADHFLTNAAYSVGSYTKGELCLTQLNYIVGKDAFDRGMKRYFNTWKFKHPDPVDFFRIMEKEADLELDWYKEYWINTIHHPDYGIDTIIGKQLKIRKSGMMPMPLDVMVTTKKGKKELYYIPVDLMRGEKKPDLVYDDYILGDDWPWINKSYTLMLNCREEDIESIVIDPSYRLVDLNRDDNIWPRLGITDKN